MYAAVVRLLSTRTVAPRPRRRKVVKGMVDTTVTNFQIMATTSMSIVTVSQPGPSARRRMPQICMMRMAPLDATMRTVDSMMSALECRSRSLSLR